MVGILLPPSVPGALVNFAATLAGKIPVNLNYTSTDEGLASCAAQCKLETVITTKLLLDRIPLKVPGKAILLEEAAAAPRFGERMMALLFWFFPAGQLERMLAGRKEKNSRRYCDDHFLQRSTGEPKGVMLSHYNIASNIEQSARCLCSGSKDCLLGRVAVFPFVRLYRDALAARCFRGGRRLPSQPARFSCRRRACARLSGDVSDVHAGHFCKPIPAAARLKISAAWNWW